MPKDVAKFDRYMTVGHDELRRGRIANSAIAFKYATEEAYAPFAAAHAHRMLGKALRLLGKADQAHVAFETAMTLAVDNELLLALIEREQRGGV